MEEKMSDRPPNGISSLSNFATLVASLACSASTALMSLAQGSKPRKIQAGLNLPLLRKRFGLALFLQGVDA